MEIEGLRFESETTWDSVWRIWQNSDKGSAESRILSARKKGWQSWEAWRDAWVRNFGAQTRRWLRYRILDALKTVSSFRVGPTQTWQKNFPEGEQNQHTFATLVERVSYNTNGKVHGILENFPDPTEFIGIVMPDKSIVDIEGHHRATALAIAAKIHRKIAFEQLPTVALTSFEDGEEALLNAMLARGSTKERPK